MSSDLDTGWPSSARTSYGIPSQWRAGPRLPGWVGGFAYVVADAARLVTKEVNIGVFPALLSVVFMIAILAGNIRYR